MREPPGAYILKTDDGPVNLASPSCGSTGPAGVPPPADRMMWTSLPACAVTQPACTSTSIRLRLPDNR